MSGKNYDYHDIQDNLNEIIHTKNSFKQKLRDFIFTFQTIDYRIQRALFIARAFYINQRDYYKQKISFLKREKIKNEQYFARLSDEMHKIASPKLDNGISKEIGLLRHSIKDIRFKISNLNYKLEGQSLDIDSENLVIEELLKLQTEEKTITIKLIDLEKNQEQKFQNSKYYHTKSRKDNLEFTLTEIHNSINKWSDRLLYSHKKMLNLYRVAREFEHIKKKIPGVLLDNTEASNYYNQLYLDLIDENSKNVLQELQHLKEIIKPRILKKKKTPDTKKIIKKRRYSKKLMEEKLAIALKKQRLGKKLDFYELKLIMDKKKNNPTNLLVK